MFCVQYRDAERDEELQAEVVSVLQLALSCLRWLHVVDIVQRALEIEQRENKAKQDRLARDRLTITYGASIQVGINVVTMHV